MEALEQWFKDNGGYLHPSVHLARDEEHGVHFRAFASLGPGTHILTVPHHLALSNLNAQVDDAFTVFKSKANSFTVEALSFFYLMAQWLNKEKSFWKPYLEVLPSPEEGYGTPFWFGDDDLLWLEGTDLAPSFVGRRDIWQRYWREGVRVLKEAGTDTSGYTWELFKWAATVFTSRSFNGNAIRPQDSRYWPAYKHGPQGRQTVLLDLSHAPEDRKTFSVLFPLMDIGNHNPIAKVDWTYDPGRFSLTVQDEIAKGEQVFNNYGPKGNDELLMGYGFCITDNPHDCVHLAMRQPQPGLQEMLRTSRLGYFKTSGEWNTEAATFKLVRSQVLQAVSQESTPSQIWDAIPVPLAEFFCYNVQLERGHTILPIGDPQQYLYHGWGRRLLPRMAYHMLMALVPKTTKLAQSTTTLPSTPQNPRQANAKIYRDGQYEILDAVQTSLARFVKSLRPAEGPVPGPAVWKLEEVFDVWKAESPDLHKSFTAGMKKFLGTSKLSKLPDTDQEEQVWVLWLCFLVLNSEPAAAESDTSDVSGTVRKWQVSLEAEYGDPRTGLAGAGESDEEEDEEDEQAAFYKSCVRRAAMFLPGSVWTKPGWSTDLILDWGVKIMNSQGTLMRFDEGGVEDVRYVLYLHVDE